MARNIRLSFFCALFLGVSCPISAFAYSYEELVQLVQAEERVFGKGDYSSSLDQRLARLETKVLGATHSGSDSERLRAVCTGLGIESHDKPSLAAPFAVVVKKATPFATLSKAKSAQSGKVKLGKQAKSAKPNFVHTNEAASTSTWAPITQTAIETQAIAAKQAQSPLAAPVQDQVMPENKDKGFTPLGIGIFAAFAFILASLGTVVYLLFNVKNESSVSFSSQFDYDYETSADDEIGTEQSQIETLVDAPLIKLPVSAPVFAAEPVASNLESAALMEAAESVVAESILIPDSAQLQMPALPSVEFAEAKVFSTEWEESLSKTLFYELADIPDNVLLNPNSARFNSKNIVGMSIAAHAVKIESEFVASAPVAPIAPVAPVLLIPDIDFGSTNLEVIDSESTESEVCKPEIVSLELPNLLSVNVSEVLHEACSTESVEESDNIVYAKWPSYEPPKAPRLSTVAVWFVRSQAEKRNRQANDPSEEITLRLPAITESQDLDESTMNDDLLNKEWECDAYKAFAQLLIDAAQHCAVSVPESPVAATVVSSRKINTGMSSAALITQNSALRQLNPEIERNLRTLFSEAS